MQVTKVVYGKESSTQVEYTQEKEHGTETSIFRAEDMGHPDLRNAWRDAKSEILKLIHTKDKEELFELRSIRFKRRDDVLDCEFTVLRKLPYTDTVLVMNLPKIAAGEGMPKALLDLLEKIEKEAEEFVKGKREQGELRLQGGEEEAEGAEEEAAVAS